MVERLACKEDSSYCSGKVSSESPVPRHVELSIQTERLEREADLSQTAALHWVRSHL